MNSLEAFQKSAAVKSARINRMLVEDMPEIKECALKEINDACNKGLFACVLSNVRYEYFKLTTEWLTSLGFNVSTSIVIRPSLVVCWDERYVKETDNEQR